MTISPAQVEAEANSLRRLYADAEVELLRITAASLARGFDSPEWASQKLADLPRVQAQIRAEVARLGAATAAQLETLVEQAYLTGMNGALADLTEVGVVRGSAMVRTNLQAAQAFIREAVSQLSGSHLRILRQADDVYRQAVAEGARNAVAGVETRRNATQRILNQFADRGVTGFQDSAGRNWSLDTYAEMATRSALGRAAVQGHVDTLQVNGQDLVIVSDSPEECHLCRPWEGRVLSLSGSSRGRVRGASGNVTIAGTVDQARSAGLFHPNCTHRLGLFVEGFTKPMKDTANPQGYEDRQQQRKLERNIRKWKLREASALDDTAREAASTPVPGFQAEMRKFVEENDRKRLYYREQVTR